jgi:hypothetical protein
LKKKEKRFDTVFRTCTFVDNKIASQNYLNSIRFVPKYAFYEGLLFNKKRNHPISYLDKEIVNTAHRKDYIVNDFIPRLKLLKETGDYAFPGCLTSGR